MTMHTLQDTLKVTHYWYIETPEDLSAEDMLKSAVIEEKKF